MKVVARGAWSARRKIILSLVALGVISATIAAPLVMARPTDPDRSERVIALSVAALMERKHISQMRLDDKISRRALEMFFETLDPMKLYFFQSDIDKFGPDSAKVDDYVRAGDVGLAKRVFDVFLQRVDERTAVAQELVDAKHDFSVGETMVRDPKKLTWFTSKEEADERWRKRVKYDLLLQTSDDKPMDEAKVKLHKRYRAIDHRWSQTDNDELLEMFLSAVTTSFDPHSSYMSPDSLQNFVIQMRLELDGIGASLESEYGETVVRHIVPGGAADKDGRLKVDDVITGVGEGDKGTVEDISDLKLTDVVGKIRGKPDTVVRLEVKTAGGAELKTYNITRARIELKDSEARSEVLERGPHGESVGADANKKKDDANKVSDASADKPAAEKNDAEKAEADKPTADGNKDNADKLAGTPNGDVKEPTGKVIEHAQPGGGVFRIGVIGLPSFYMDMEARRDGRDDYKSTTRDVKRLLEGFKKQNVDLVIVDLRFNGGGSLPEAVETTGLFIDQGPVVQVKGTDGRVQPYPDIDPGATWDGPLVVMINRFSASASEIFAGAIQDYGRGIVVGDRSTHGKGTVQQLEELGRLISPINPPNYGALKMTIQQFYRPGGDSTQNRGVVSDIELPSQMSDWEGIGENDLDYALKFDRVQPLPHDNYPFARPTVIQELRKRSEQRCAKDDYFIAEKHRIERYLERKKDPTLTLNKEKFDAERKELNTEKEQEKLFDDLQTNDRPVYPKTPYNDEVIAIALDYLELFGDARLAQR